MKNDDKMLKKEDLLSLDKEALVALFSSTVGELSSENQKQAKIIAYYEAKLRQSTQEYERLMEQIILAKKDRFGVKSEKSISNQLNLFNEAELFCSDSIDNEAIKAQVSDITKSKKPTVKTKQNHMLDDSNLRVEEIIFDLSEHEKEGYEYFGKETKKLLKYQPSEWYIQHHIYPKYRKETSDESYDIVSANQEPSVFLKSSLSSSALSHILSLKYNLGLPLYRIERDLQSQNVALSRQTLSNWCIKASEEYLAHLVMRMQSFLLKEPILHVDETTTQVLHHQDESTNKKSYIWLYRSGRENKRPILIYDYQPTRGYVHPSEFLEGYQGYLQSDGYKVYEKLDHVKRVGCLAHARRKFIEAKEVANKNTEGFVMASTILKQINHIMALDKKTSLLSLEEKQLFRFEKEKPSLDQFKQLLIQYQPMVLEKSHLGKAIAYSLNQFESFERVLEDPRLEWTNNAAERAIKPFVMGRKAWLFSNTTRGAQSSAIIYSVIQSALENKLHVERYLTFVFEQMKQKTITNENQFDYLLPHSVSLPDFCYQAYRTTISV